MFFTIGVRLNSNRESNLCGLASQLQPIFRLTLCHLYLPLPGRRPLVDALPIPFLSLSFGHLLKAVSQQAGANQRRFAGRPIAHTQYGLAYAGYPKILDRVSESLRLSFPCHQCWLMRFHFQEPIS